MKAANLAPLGVSLVLGLLVAACPQQKICAPGTTEQEGQCVPVPVDGLVCGPGTELVGNACVLVDGADVMGDAPDGVDTPGPDSADGDGLDGDAVADADAADDTADGGEDSGEPDASDATDATDGDGDGDGGTEIQADIPTDLEDGGDSSDAPDVVVCVPLCVGKACGDDGCGGTCGSCTDPATPVCNTLLGQCAASCVPNCLGKACGDDGCGGVCGTCAAGTDCLTGQCVPDGWTCDPSWYGAQDACDCNCGAIDPDCNTPGTPEAGCGPSEKCVDGVCQGAPASWTCGAGTYDALDACDCGCGAPDPDCQYDDFAVIGCPGIDSACLPDGTCQACTPDCDGKTCGLDGCGGICGTCSGPVLSACLGGQCVAPCDPEPVACVGNVCGDDGCGGVCGTCGSDETCDAGQCIPDDIPPDPASCLDNCGSTAPAGCYCTPGCAAAGTCCADYVEECVCVPDCSGKTCGGDGCGGSCGTCSGATPHCGADQTCTNVCVPDCDGKSCGDDGCGGTCGTCAAAETCGPKFLCVPDAWSCPAVYFGDDLGCDCGCGAPDPDCDGQTVVLGCPTSTTGCSAGVCEVSFCNSNSDCPNQWCTGAYGTGTGTLGGVCATPDPFGEPPGTPCFFHEECASGACIGDQCRMWCTSDGDCGSDLGTCRGVFGTPAGIIYTGGVQQVATVCDLLTGSAVACTNQLNCALGGEMCGALIDPVTLGPKFVCGVAPTQAQIGASCNVFECAHGLVCAEPSGGGEPVCTVPCPAGAEDCDGGETCTNVPFHNAGTTDPADDPMVPVCLP